MATNKPRLIKDFEKLSEEMQEQVKAAYPTGFFKFMVDYYDKEGNKKSALPFETDEFLYLVKMPPVQTKSEKDDDDDDDYGTTKKKKKAKLDDDDFADLDDLTVADEPSEDPDDGFDDY